MLETSALWSGVHVMERLVEAYKIDRRLPGKRSLGIKSSWPGTPMHTFAEMIDWQETESARQRIWASWERGTIASPQEITRMEQSFSWLGWIPGEERQALELWAKVTAKGISVRNVLDRRGMPRTTFYRNRNHGAQHIADRLNG